MAKGRIEAYINEDLINEIGDKRVVGVEIFRSDSDERDYEFFYSKEDAERRIKYIMERIITSWEEIGNYIAFRPKGEASHV